MEEGVLVDQLLVALPFYLHMAEENAVLRQDHIADALQQLYGPGKEGIELPDCPLSEGNALPYHHGKHPSQEFDVIPNPFQVDGHEEEALDTLRPVHLRHRRRGRRRLLLVHLLVKSLAFQVDGLEEEILDHPAYTRLLARLLHR